MDKGAKLQDMLSYQPDSYYSEDELALIRRTFKDNPALVSILRKTFIPTISDPNLPIEEFAKDWMLIGKKWDNIPREEREVLAVARQEAIEFVMGGLIYLKTIANMPVEDEQANKERRKKDSTK